MDKVAVVIPNYNGYRYLETCFAALAKQTFTEFTTYFVDNGSQDESCAFLREHYPETKIIQLDDNYGFSRAVNEGIRRSKEPYVILLNNDTEVFPDFVERLYEGICKRKNAFACSAKLISYQERDKIDDAGNYYNMLGWAFARGKGKPVSEFETSDRIFAACAGAAIYRREFLEKTGLFDEEHFAYLEDTDIGYRARLLGYENWYEPSAKVYHVGSGTSGSRYNLFKIRYSSRNNIYLIYKNMPVLQILLNLPVFILGFSAKLVFFASKGYGKEYLAGIKNGHLPEAGKQSKKDPFRVEAPRHVFCHRMGAFYQCVPEISGEGIRILSKDYEKVKKFTEIRRMLEKYDCSFLELIV